MLLTETSYSCAVPYTSNLGFVVDLIAAWCGMTAAAGVLSLTISILSGAVALVIGLSTRRTGGLNGKLTAPDNVGMAQAQMTTPYIASVPVATYVHGAPNSPFVQVPAATFTPGAPTVPFISGTSVVPYAPGAPGFVPGTPGLPYTTNLPLLHYNAIPIRPEPSDPMPRPAAVRTAIYSLILVFGITVDVIGPFALIFAGLGRTTTVKQAGMAFAGIASLCSLFTWIWASVLLSYNRRFYSTQTVTRASAHCISTMVLSIVWFVISIMVFAFVGASGTCSNRLNLFETCPFNLSLGCLCLSLSILLGSVSLYIYLRTTKRGAQIAQVNVAQFDGDMPQPMQMQMQMPTQMQTGYQEEKSAPAQPAEQPTAPGQQPIPVPSTTELRA
ncbi:hypothetical protein PM082_007254 [Marasmius tenuissimus]|nr:hypothetical protein PM082_007254 [Marasmius tenuissimus]